MLFRLLEMLWGRSEENGRKGFGSSGLWLLFWRLPHILNLSMHGCHQRDRAGGYILKVRTLARLCERVILNREKRWGFHCWIRNRKLGWWTLNDERWTTNNELTIGYRLMTIDQWLVTINYGPRTTDKGPIMKELLLEIGTEEIPAGFIPQALMDLESLAKKGVGNESDRVPWDKKPLGLQDGLCWSSNLSQKDRGWGDKKDRSFKTSRLRWERKPYQAAIGFC